MLKRLLIVFAAVILLGGIATYYLTRGEKEALGPPPDLTGRWAQVGASTAPGSDWFFYADISDGLIEVWKYSPDYDERVLYWSGTFTPPQDGKLPYTWESANDIKKAKTSQHASREPSKSFTYNRDERISFIPSTGGTLMMQGCTLERTPADFAWPASVAPQTAQDK